MAHWTNLELAYLAGIVDGEGHITAGHYPKLGKFTPVFGVSSTTPILLEWLQERFGGRIYARGPQANRPQDKPKFEWRLSQREMDAVLPEITPFLIVKARHALLMQEFRQTFHRKGPVPKAIVAERQRLWLEIRTLNRLRKDRLPLGSVSSG